MSRLVVNDAVLNVEKLRPPGGSLAMSWGVAVSTNKAALTGYHGAPRCLL